MSLKNLPDVELHQKTLLLVNEERRLTAEILRHLREISARRLYAIMGYSSLWEYCVKGLKYSEGSAQRRISAMRMIAEIPELEEKIVSGSVLLSTVSQIQSAIRAQSLRVGIRSKTTQETISEKRALIIAVEGKSQREAERIIARVAPQEILPERERILTDTHTEVRFVMDSSLEAKLAKVRALTSHRKFNPSYAELIELMADLVIDKLDPEREKRKKKLAETKDTQTTPPPPMAERSGKPSSSNKIESSPPPVQTFTHKSAARGQVIHRVQPFQRACSNHARG